MDGAAGGVTGDQKRVEGIAADDERGIAGARPHRDIVRRRQTARLHPFDPARHPSAVRMRAEQQRGFGFGDVKAAASEETPGADVVAMAVRQEDVGDIRPMT